MSEHLTDHVYRMNPAEDRIVYGDELAEGMWVLEEKTYVRTGVEGGPDGRLRGQRFRRVTRLRKSPATGDRIGLVHFVGEWIDGYQQTKSCSLDSSWLAKKEPDAGAGESP